MDIHSTVSLILKPEHIYISSQRSMHIALSAVLFRKPNFTVCFVKIYRLHKVKSVYFE